MKIYEFTLPQIEYYRTFCNFDEREAAVFDLRSKNIPLDRCAEILQYEDIKKISARVKKKVVQMTDENRINDWIENVYWKNVIQNQ